MDSTQTHLLPPSFRLAAGRLELDPRDSVFFQNPYPTYEALRSGGPLVEWAELGCRATGDHALVSALLRDRRFGRVLPAGADGRPSYDGMPAHLANFYRIERHSLLDLEPPAHSRLRGLVLKAFVSRRIERLGPRIRQLADELIDGFVGHGKVELVAEFATPLPVTVIAELIGVDAGDAALLLDWSHRLVAMYQFGRTEAVERDADRAAAEFAAFVRDAIAAKRRRPSDDLISALITAETERGGLDEDEMISTVVLLMNAGHEATVHQIGNGMKAILEADLPDARAIFAEEASASRAVEEILRFDTPLHMFKRVALGDTVLEDGTRFRRGEEVALLLGAANRDPAVFADPARFDPGPKRPSPASFGAGIHFCVGAPLARLELGVAFAALFRRLERLRIAAPPRYRDSWHFRGLERLDLEFEPAALTS